MTTIMQLPLPVVNIIYGYAPEIARTCHRFARLSFIMRFVLYHTERLRIIRIFDVLNLPEYMLFGKIYKNIVKLGWYKWCMLSIAENGCIIIDDNTTIDEFAEELKKPCYYFEQTENLLRMACFSDSLRRFMCLDIYGNLVTERNDSMHYKCMRCLKYTRGSKIIESGCDHHDSEFYF